MFGLEPLCFGFGQKFATQEGLTQFSENAALDDVRQLFQGSFDNIKNILQQIEVDDDGQNAVF